MKTRRQHVMHCPCGNAKVLALGLCATCYTLKRQDEEHFGGLREAALERDGYRCRVCDASGRDKRSIIVHHRVPGNSVINLMLALCPACHAKVHRTKAVLSAMHPLLLKLWREQHPKGHEQTALNFAPKKPVAILVPLFDQDRPVLLESREELVESDAIDSTSPLPSTVRMGRKSANSSVPDQNHDGAYHPGERE